MRNIKCKDDDWTSDNGRWTPDEPSVVSIPHDEPTVVSVHKTSLRLSV